MRAVVSLRVEDGLPFREIAERMQITEGATKAHYFQATQRMREQLGHPAPAAARSRAAE